MKSFDHPGGNITGFTIGDDDIDRLADKLGCEGEQIGFAGGPAHLNLDIVSVCPSEFTELSLQL